MSSSPQVFPGRRVLPPCRDRPALPAKSRRLTNYTAQARDQEAVAMTANGHQPKRRVKSLFDALKQKPLESWPPALWRMAAYTNRALQNRP
jgi:hypothetical protein